MTQIVKFIISGIFLFFSGLASTAGINNLLITGNDTLPGIVGSYSMISSFSWMTHLFPGASVGHSWTLGPGTSGGILLGRTQNPGELTGTRLMFNQPTSIYSVNGGVTIDLSDSIDMSNLRMLQSGTVIDIGSGSGYQTSVPRVTNVLALQTNENGWQLNTDNTYHIIYRTRGTCIDCMLTIHFYGNHIKASGDINNDGSINVTDILLAQQAYMGNLSFDIMQQLRADVAPIVNGAPQPDGMFGVPDILVIQRTAAGLISF